MQQLNPSEISEIIKGRIEKLDVSSQARNEGTIVSVSDGIVRIHGLADVMYGEMIEFPGGVYGMALNLEQDSVGAASWKYRLVRNCWAASSTPWATRSTAKVRSTLLPPTRWRK
jgi:F0F1-type ATP synthase alpha subunit